ncbi:MAG: hypothetical protein FWG20_00625, partial [Candidatus Cloacimonetes bacterium]|nr:hypothetical protein [Candidatus Cloacimonadota bacterium]
MTITRFIVCLILFGCFVLCCISCQKSDPTPVVQLPEPDIDKHETIDIYIPKGGSVYEELSKIGLNGNQIVDLLNVFGYNVDFRGVQPNDHFQIIRDLETKTVLEFVFFPNIITTHRIVYDSAKQAYDYVLEEKEVLTRVVLTEGVVYHTLDQALREKKIDSNVMATATSALETKIDFRLRTTKGDVFKLLY